MVTIRKFLTVDEAQLARMKLEGSGLEAFLADETMVGMNWAYSNAMGGVRLQVKDEDRERALEILELPPSEEGATRCPDCGSQNINYRKITFPWAVVGFSILFPIPSTKLSCMDCGKVFKPELSD